MKKVSLHLLATEQKLIKSDIIPIYAKLGYPFPAITRKNELLATLDAKLATENARSSGDLQLIALDMGLKNMSLARLHLRKGAEIPVLQEWFKKDLEPSEEFIFNPMNYAQITNQFLGDHIIPKYAHAPEKTHLIFERQRFRTGGGSAVLESTLKTNTIEAMLCMGLTMHNKNYNKDMIEFSPSTPGSMVKYWQQSCMSDISLTGKMNEKESKGFRINLVLNMLHRLFSSMGYAPRKVKPHAVMNKEGLICLHKERFHLGENVCKGLEGALKLKKWEDCWNAAWSFKSQTRRLWEVAFLMRTAGNDALQIEAERKLWGTVKGDDLADSLLHGIAYFEYMANRRELKKAIAKKEDIRDFIR